MTREPTLCPYCFKPLPPFLLARHKKHCPRRLAGQPPHSPEVVAFTALLLRQWAEDGQQRRRTGR